MFWDSDPASRPLVEPQEEQEEVQEGQGGVEVEDQEKYLGQALHAQVHHYRNGPTHEEENGKEVVGVKRHQCPNSPKKSILSI